MDLELPLSDGEDLLSFDFELEEEEDLDPDVGVEGRLLGLSLLPLSLDLDSSLTGDALSFLGLLDTS